MMKSLVESVNIRYTTVNERKNIYQIASHISFVEFGDMPLSCKDIIKEYVLGKKSLPSVLKNMIDFWVQSCQKDKISLFDNLLGIYDSNILQKALSSIIVVRLMMLSEIPIYDFNYNTYKSLHKFIFGDVFPWAGEERNFDLEKKFEIVGNRYISFLKFTEIKPQLKKIIEHTLADVYNYSSVDIAIKDTLEKLNLKWDSFSSSQRAEILAEVTGNLFFIHPFLSGNITLSLFFIQRFTYVHGFPIDVATFRDVQTKLMSQDKSIDLKVIIFMASLNKYLPFKDTDALASVFYNAMESAKKATLRDAISNDNRVSLELRKKEAKEILDRMQDGEDYTAEIDIMQWNQLKKLL